MKVKLGTRGSLLALTQSNLVAESLKAIHPDIEVELVEIKTLGDRKQGTAKASQSDKKDWVYDLELALLNRSIDFAVHSGKDCPSEAEPGTALRSVLLREDPRDAFVGKLISESGERLKFKDIAADAKIGTASLRRGAQLLVRYPKVTVVEHRGNVPTRIEKLDRSDSLDGIILACAGLQRLAIEGLQYDPISVEQMLPALNQGTLVVQFRADDTQTQQLLAGLTDDTTQACWLAERTVAEVLEGDCKSAISIFAEEREGSLYLRAEVLSPNGRDCIKADGKAPLSEAHELGIKVGHNLLDQGARKILEAATAKLTN